METFNRFSDLEFDDTPAPEESTPALEEVLAVLDEQMLAVDEQMNKLGTLRATLRQKKRHVLAALAAGPAPEPKSEEERFSALVARFAEFTSERGVKYPADMREEAGKLAASLHGEGVTWTTLQETLGVSYPTLRGWVEKYA